MKTLILAIILVGCSVEKVEVVAPGEATTEETGEVNAIQDIDNTVIDTLTIIGVWKQVYVNPGFDTQEWVLIFNEDGTYLSYFHEINSFFGDTLQKGTGTWIRSEGKLEMTGETSDCGGTPIYDPISVKGSDNDLQFYNTDLPCKNTWDYNEVSTCNFKRLSKFELTFDYKSECIEGNLL